MTLFLWSIHILNCALLIIIVLLQAGKGASMGFSLGGGASQTVFGSSGGKNFFAKLTTALAIIFMCTSILLSIISSRSSENYRGIMKQMPTKSEKALPAKLPVAKQPETKQSEAKKIDVKQSENKKIDIEKPETKKPEAKQSEAKQ